MNRIFAWLFFLFLTICVQAQFSVGVRQGYGTHGVHFDPITLNENQVALWLPNTALVIAFNNKLNTGLQTEFSLAQKGWREEDSIPNTYFYRKINYLEIPFFSHFEIGKGKVRPVILAGPYVAIKLSESSDSLNYNYPTEYLYHTQEIRKIDYGIKFGLGLRYNITKHLAVFSEVRYDLQLAGGRDIFIDRPNNILASRLTEIGGTFGILWHIIPQKKDEAKKGYVPKENLYGED
jgi:hypothetical protein